MNQFTSRLVRFKKRLRRNRFLRIFLLGHLLLCICLSILIFRQYQATSHWDQRLVQQKQSDLAPELVADRYTPVAANDLQILNQLDHLVWQAQQAKRLTKPLSRKATKLLKISAKIFRRHLAGVSHARTLATQLRLYLAINAFLKQAQVQPNPQKLNHLLSQLLKLNLQNPQAINERYMASLSRQAKSYNDLADFLDHSFQILGENRHHTLLIAKRVQAKDVNKLLCEIKAKHLTAYPAIKQMVKLLHSSKLKQILATNQQEQLYQTWLAVLKRFNCLHQSDYRSVASISTYRDVLQAHLKIANPPSNSQGAIDEKSLVYGLYYHGKKLANDQYFQLKTDVRAVIAWQYQQTNPGDDNQTN